MKIILYDTATPHPKGKFCKRVVCNHYFISWFETPFIYEREGKLLRGNVGDMLVIPPGSPVYHGGVPEADTGFVNDWIYFGGTDLQLLFEKYPLPLCTAFPMGLSSPMCEYLDQIRIEQAASMPGSADKLFYLTAQFVIDTYRKYKHTCCDDVSTDSIARIHKAIQQHPEYPWTLHEMSQRSGYSVSRFSALYHVRYGSTPKQDVIKERLSMACRLLQFTGTPIAEVASASGFQSIHYFSKYFKEVMGITPSSYAKDCRDF